MHSHTWVSCTANKNTFVIVIFVVVIKIYRTIAVNTPQSFIAINSLWFQALPSPSSIATKTFYDYLPCVIQNSREEVTTATAYLDLFLRKISEPSLIKAFLMFIFMEKNDEIVILDSLITRINSSSRVSSLLRILKLQKKICINLY